MTMRQYFIQRNASAAWVKGKVAALKTGGFARVRQTNQNAPAPKLDQGTQPASRGADARFHRLEIHGPRTRLGFGHDFLSVRAVRYI